MPDPPNPPDSPSSAKSDPSKPSTETDTHPATDPTPISSAAQASRLERFRALQTRASASAKSNLADARAEATRISINPTTQTNLSRKAAVASHSILKDDTETAEGKGAFERKRAWDYTIEESERWDARMEKKRRGRDGVAFQDYSAEAEKVYERQMKGLEKGGGEGRLREEYEEQKERAVEKAARSGGLEIVELESGEVVGVDRDGTFYAGEESTGLFVEAVPKKENVDRLVEDIKKAEEVRLRKRRERLGKGEGEGDVTFINDKNKLFNQKLARFYDKYTGEIRESFERGTAL